MIDNRTWFAVGVAASAFVFTAPYEALAQSAAPDYQINLPSQDLSKSLNDIAKQTSTEIAFDGEQAGGRRAPALRGRFTAIEAVRRLLEGSGLRARVGSSGVIIVQSGGQVSETGGNNIVVTGFRQAFNKALDRKRNADQVIDVITSEDIGQFPDQNVTEALQRIAGVSIQRNNGEGELVSIRGLDPIFTRVEIDGRTTTITADSSNPERSAVLSPLVSDLYSSIEVVKSPTAADVEGGIGGTVRLNTPSPLEIGELTFAAEAGVNYSEYRESYEPSVLGFYADTFAGGTLGVLAIVSYEEQSRRVDLYNNNPYFTISEGDLDDDTDPAQLALVGGAVTDRSRQEQRDGDRSRFNATLKVEYEPNDDLFFSLNGFFAQDERDEDRSRIQAQWGRGSLTGGTVGADGVTLDNATFRRHRVDINTFNRIATIESYGITGDLTFTPDAWTIDLNANYGKSEEDYDEYVVQSRVNRDDAGGYDTTQGPRTPVVFTDAANLELADLDVRSLNFEQRIISLEEYSGQTDIAYEFDSPVFRAIQFGGRYSSTRFDRLQGVIQSDADLTLADAPDANFVVDGTFGRGAVDNILGLWPSTDPFTFYNAFPSTDEFSFNDEQVYFVEEDVWAAYGMLKFDGDVGGQDLRGNIGVRYVDTSFNGEGRIDVDGADFGEILIDSAPALDASYQ
ncbi:MAG: TonB-dependent receptor, partial [Pseudomonadota bacterium]